MSFYIRLMISSAFFINAPSFAQQGGLPPLPERVTNDSNGVDLAAWGHVSYTWSPISIGTPDQGGIKLEFYGPGVARSNFSASLRRPDPYDQPTQFATFGSSSTTFDNNMRPPSTPGARLNGAVYILRDGTEIHYIQTSNGNLYEPITYYPTEARFPSGEVWTYNNKLLQDPYYPLLRRAQSITSNRGYQVKFEYASGTIWQIRKIYLVNNSFEYCDPYADICSFSQSWPTLTVDSPSYNETIATNDQGYQYRFLNSPIGPGQQKIQIFEPGSTSEAMNYVIESYVHPQGGDTPTTRVKSLTKDGSTWNYSYTISNSLIGTITRTAPDLTVQLYSVTLGDLEGISPSKVDWAKNELNDTSSFTYDSFGQVLTAQHPEGDSLQVDYDERGNVWSSVRHAKPGAGLADITQTASYPTSPYPWAICTYPTSCNKPTLVVDARGAETRFTYDNVHGGVLSAMSAPPASGGARPLVLTTWTQRYAWVKDASGSMVQATSPVWLKLTETQCQTVAGSDTPTCDSGASQAVTTYEYGAVGSAESLLIKGRAVSSEGGTLRTCYSYDRYARKISETQPNANLGACP